MTDDELKGIRHRLERWERIFPTGDCWPEDMAALLAEVERLRWALEDISEVIVNVECEEHFMFCPWCGKPLDESDLPPVSSDTRTR